MIEGERDHKHTIQPSSHSGVSVSRSGWIAQKRWCNVGVET